MGLRLSFAWVALSNMYGYDRICIYADDRICSILFDIVWFGDLNTNQFSQCEDRI